MSEKEGLEAGRVKEVPSDEVNACSSTLLKESKVPSDSWEPLKGYKPETILIRFV